MSSPALFFELWKYCPQLACGEVLAAEGGDSGDTCPVCSTGFKRCSACRATNRLLVEFCRSCGRHFESQGSYTQTGLTLARTNTQTINEIGQTKLIHLGAGVAAQPLTSDGLVFVPRLDGFISVVNAAAGKIVGQLFVGGRIEVAPALAGGLLFVAAGTRLHAFDLIDFLDQPASQNFKPAWTVESSGEYITQPVVADERAVFFVSKRGDAAIVDAVSQETGESLWPAPAEVATYMTLPPVLLKDQLVVVTQGSDVYSFHPLTGQATISRLNFELDVAVSPAVTGEDRFLLADARGYIFEVHADSPKAGAIPVYDHRNPVTSISASDDFITYGHRSGLALLNAHGDRRWAYDSYETITVTPALCGASIFAVDDAGNGLLFGTLNANPKTKVRLLPGGEVRTPPIVAGRHLVAASGDGKLVTIEWR
ncbi:MAG TPA: PQQ-binding-like beta-propeller repeat protein [Pyrinomonadaceae bacterium]|nr:PQQ-binding-like beta-propeller repeat protein [Pyrinomonadaceae bacterium]